MQLFRHSPADGVLVSIGIGHTALLFCASLLVGFAPIWTLIGLGLLLVALHATNVNVVAHNFVHNPFFERPWLNRAFSVLNTLGLGFPQEAYRVVHMHHHAYNNDLPDEKGETRDRFSIYRFGKNGRAENFLPYVIFCHVRLDVIRVVRRLRREGKFRIAALEAAVLIAAMLALYLANRPGFVFFFIPVYLLSWSASYAESYCEHYGSQSGNRLADAVSCYDRLYNRLWFNNGYHMEHHYRPGAHWSELPRIHREQADKFRSAGYRVIRGAHLLGIFQPPRES